MPEGPAGPVLGIDYGTRTIGLALGHPLLGTARPLEPLRQRSGTPPVSALDAVLEHWRPACIVIGLPLDSDGGDTAMSRLIREFADELRSRHPDIQLELHDERLSSVAAGERFADSRAAGQSRRKDKRLLDSLAAAVIVESWMSNRG